jgi:hypothetical protein
MTWLTWRQFRAQAVVVYAALAGFAVVLAVTGPRLARLARLDQSVFDHLTRADRDLFYVGIVVLAAVPGLLGAFWGAPLVARELEMGTHRLVWNQSVTRGRWLAAKLGCAVLASALGVGVLTWLVTWWSHPIDGALSSTHGSLPSRLTPVSFAMRGVVPVAYGVFAVVLGVLIGTVLRRSLVAMALTLAVFTALQVVVPLWVRPHLAAPVRAHITISRATLDGIESSGPGTPLRLQVHTAGRGDWLLSNQTVDAAGRAVALPSWMSDCLPPPPAPGTPTPTRVAADGDPLGGCLDRLSAEGYRQLVVYQPASRFWRLQWTESGLYLGLSALLAGASFVMIRRR